MIFFPFQVAINKMAERDNKPRKRKPAGDDNGDVENQSDEEKKTKKPPPRCMFL